MNRDLFLAILSMDSYNRGYGCGIKFAPNESPDPRNEAGKVIGNATVLNIDLPAGSQAAGFYAIAYTVTGVAGIADGTTVIAFRGTDGAYYIKDVLTGWSIGGGLANIQSNLMISFYQAVARSQGVTADWRTANITLTGHSLGGGLASLAANDNQLQRIAA